MDTFEEELLSKLNDSILNGNNKVEDDSSKYFSQLSQSYPTCGAKIDWSKIENAVIKAATAPNCDAQFITFVTNIIQEHQLQGQCIVIGDSAIDKALFMSINTLYQFH